MPETIHRGGVKLDIIWLVVDLPLWKMMDLKSVGMIFHSQLNGKIIQMFQTTNQIGFQASFWWCRISLAHPQYFKWCSNYECTYMLTLFLCTCVDIYPYDIIPVSTILSTYFIKTCTYRRKSRSHPTLLPITTDPSMSWGLGRLLILLQKSSDSQCQTVCWEDFATHKKIETYVKGKFLQKL